MTENALTARRKLNITMQSGNETIKENEALMSSLNELENKISNVKPHSTAKQKNIRKGKKHGGY